MPIFLCILYWLSLNHFVAFVAIILCTWTYFANKKSINQHWFHFFKNFNWRIIALHNFVVFCHTSSRISHRYTHVPSLPSHSPPHPSPCHRAPVWVPWFMQQIPIGYLFYTWFCKFLLLSPYISPSPSSPPTLSIGLFSMSVSPLPPWK